MRWVPSAVITAAVISVGALGAACDPLPPFQGPIPVPIPSVTPVEVCQHHVVPGYRFYVVIPQNGGWAIEYRDVVGNWIRTVPYPFTPGSTFSIETNSTFHVVWAPDTAQNATWHVVSGDVTPAPGVPGCPDY